MRCEPNGGVPGVQGKCSGAPATSPAAFGGDPLGSGAVSSEGAIVVGGEALVDLVREPEAGTLRAHEGGGPYNTARTLARLEQPVRFLGCLSTDLFGARLREGLAGEGVALDDALTTPLPTTLALAELDASGSAIYSFYTQGTSAPALTPEAALAALPANVAMLHVGTLGLVLEPIASALNAAVEAVADRALVMVDPNCRPSVIPDREAYRRELATTLRHAHVVKASADDLRWLDPERTPVAAARALLDDGPQVALMTDGGEGAIVVMAGEDERRVPAPDVRVVDTIGAGDAFSAGFLAWWRLRGLGRSDLADAAAVCDATAFACAVAARTCERAGASPPRLAELDAPSPR
jgi:fructokinase